MIAPLRPGAGIEQNADDGKIKRRPRVGRLVGCAKFSADEGPAVNALKFEMPPSRMQRNIQRRICGAHRFDYKIGRRIQPLQIDLKVEKLAIETKFKQFVRARTHRFTGQKRKRNRFQVS